MKKLTLALTLLLALGCGRINRLLDKTEAIPDKLDAFSGGIDDTNGMIREQKLALLIDILSDEKNQEFLAPYPGDLLGPGRFLAETFTTLQALEWTHASIKKINTFNYDATYPNSPDDDVLKAKFEHKKIGLFMAVTIVAGYLPDAVINDIIKNYIQKSDRYTTAGIAILALRGKFYNDVMLGGNLYSEKFSTLGHLKQAIEFNSKLERLARLPYANSLEVEITGMMADETNEAMSVHFDSSVVASNWNKIKQFAQDGFVIRSFSENQADDAAERQRQKSEFSSMIQFVDEKLKASVQIQ